MAKITIDWSDNVKIKEEFEVPYAVARAVETLIEHYLKYKQVEGKPNVLEVDEK